MINRPTGMDSSVNNALSLFFTIDTMPSANPTTPITASIGLGKGSRMWIAKAETFNDITMIKTSVRITDHFPAFDFDQNFIFMLSLISKIEIQTRNHIISIISKMMIRNK